MTAEGQEIERARALLTALGRARVVPADRATRAYEGWAAEVKQPPRPFSRYLIEEQVAPTDHVRLLLRALAMQGLPHPELFTHERFEDLLIGQLGIESQVLSPKLLATVRKVQDKKAQEGKLRRLAELLPRAGFDPKLLTMLEQHLKERALICKGCLARYPRRGIDLGEIVCPRCTATIEAPAVDLQASMAASQEMERLPEEQRRALQESAERVIQTVSVGARGRRRGDPSKAVMFGLTASLLLVGGAIVVLKNRPPEPPRPPRPVGPPTPPGPGPGTTPPPVEVPGELRGLLAVRAQEESLLPQGRWDEALRAWREVKPGKGEEAALEQARATRVPELERLAKLAKEGREALSPARSAEPDLEERLADLLRRAGREAEPPFRDARLELEQRRAQRRARAREAARTRLGELTSRGLDGDAVWAARQTRLQARDHLLHAAALPDELRDAQVTGLDRAGFELRRRDGGTMRLRWEDDPTLGLEVVRELCRGSTAPEDKLELLLRALLARDPPAAREVADGLGVDRGLLDPDEVIRGAPTAAPVLRSGEQRWRLRWPTRWAPHDLAPGEGTKVQPGPQGLRVDGDQARLAGRPVPVVPGKPRLVVSGEVEPAGASELTLVLELRQESAVRAYRLRWGARTWTLELDTGGGANPVRSGALTTAARRVKLELGQARTAYRLAVTLDGVELVETNVSSPFEAVRLELLSNGAWSLVELELEGELDRAWVESGRSAYQASVERQVAGIDVSPAPAAESGLAPLSVEDALGLSALGPPDRSRLAAARAALAAGKPEDAASTLRGLPLEVPAVAWARAWLACLQGDPGLAERLLRPQLARDESFAEARALRALALARLGRFDAAIEEARRALDALPTQALALLAQARAGQLGRDLGAPPGEPAPEVLGLPLRLAGRDPLVKQEVAALREALRVERSFPRRFVGEQHAVLFEDEGFGRTARDLAQRLDAFCFKLPRVLLSAKPPTARPVAVAILPQREYAPLAPASTQAAWLPLHGLLALRGVAPAELGWDQALPLAECWVERVAPGLPPWAAQGLAAYAAEAALAQPPAGWVERLRARGPWTPEEWARLFELDRPELEAAPLARAKAWSLLRLAEWRPPLRRDLTRLVEQAATGQPQDWSPFTKLDPAGLEPELDQLLEKRPAPR